MLSRLLLVVFCSLAAAAAARAQTLPCADPAADPCVLGSTATVPVGLYDIRPKSLSVANKTITVSGAGELKILANNITIQPGGRFIATGTDGNTTVTLDATGIIDLQSQGTSKSRIDVSGNFGGGTINLHSVGDLNVIGTLLANATNTLGYGGPINILSDTGNVTIGGDPSEGLKSLGNSQGGGGSITIEATLGAISISTQVVAKGGDCGSCEVNLTAGTDITATSQGVLDLQASGVGDGGFVSAYAEGNITLGGNILANGSSDDFDGGSGGDVLIGANGSVTLGGRVELNGAGQDAAPGSTNGSVDGDGGSVDISGTSITINGPQFGTSKGFGQSDEFSYDASGDVTFGPAAEVDVSGDNYSGDITITADGLVTLNSRFRSITPIDPVNKPSALGGTIDLSGCSMNETSTGKVISTGPGGAPSGAVYLAASNAFTISGEATATSEVELDWRNVPPVVTGPVTPAPSILQDPFLACCGVLCPTTTTSTSTTTTTSTSSTSSSTSSTTSTSSAIPTTLPETTTSSSTLASTTSTSSTSPSTTSTVPPTTSTSSSTTLATTTSSSTSLASTSSTTSTTAAATTSTTSSTTPTTTSTLVPTTSTTTVVVTSSSTSTQSLPPTTSTTMPTSCLDTSVGVAAVQCRVGLMSTLLGQASETELGGRKLARQLGARVKKVSTLLNGPATKKRLKKAGRLLKGFSNQLRHGLAKRKTPIDPTLGAQLGSLVTEARSELAGISTP